MTQAEAQPKHWLFRLLREPVNSLTHFAGAVLSVVGLSVLLILSNGEPWRTTSFAIYGASLVLLYSASTLYHSLKVGERGLRALKRFDHIAIFALIAGTYTPVALVTLQGERAAWGWSIFGVIWGFAVLGFVTKLFFIHAPRWFSTLLYVLMGWLAVVAIVPIVQAMPFGGVVWLGLGGLFYSVGAVIYGSKNPTSHVTLVSTNSGTFLYWRAACATS